MVNHIYDEAANATLCGEYSGFLAEAVSVSIGRPSCPECAELWLDDEDDAEAKTLADVLNEHFWHPPVPNKKHPMAWGGCYCGWQITPAPYESSTRRYNEHLQGAIEAWMENR